MVLVLLMDLRNKMDEEPQEFKSDEQLNYEARNSAAAYDMNIYHMLASKAQSNVENFFIGSTINNRKRDKKTAAAVRKAYALMRDRAYNKTDETFEETQARKQGFRQMSAQVYKNKNLYVDYSDTNKKISQGWSIVGKEDNEAKVTGETNIIHLGRNGPDNMTFR